MDSKESQRYLQEIITTGQEPCVGNIVERDLQIRVLPQKVSVCMGVRRCGKSTLMQGMMQSLIEQGLPKENLVHLNFMDERLPDLLQGEWNRIYEAYYGMYPHKRRAEKVVFLFDEMQDYPNWELFIERMRRDENCDIYLTGSSSRLLSHEIASCLRGRTLSWELFPFSYGEYLTRCGVSRKRARTTAERLKQQKAWVDYEQEGGFPEVYGLPGTERRNVLQEYFASILYRDVVDRNKVQHPVALRHLSRRVINRVGALFSINKNLNEFKSLGISMTRAEMENYLQWLEDAYFLISVPCASASLGEQQRRMKKLYCIDHALAAACGLRFTENAGSRLENIVAVALRRCSRDLYYYNTRNGHEVDFLVHLPDGRVHIVQVSTDIAGTTTRNREVRALTEAMAELSLRHAYLITQNHEEEIPTAQGTIHVVPAYLFLMGRDPLWVEP